MPSQQLIGRVAEVLDLERSSSVLARLNCKVLYNRPLSRFLLRGCEAYMYILSSVIRLHSARCFQIR